MRVEPELHLQGRLTEGSLGLILNCNEGQWELEAPRSIRRLIGHDVEVTGQRTGFNGLICNQVWIAGTPRPRGRRVRWELLAVSALIFAGILASLWGLIALFL